MSHHKVALMPLLQFATLQVYLMMTSITDRKTVRLVTYLFLDIMLEFDFPKILHCDNGMEFKSKLTQYLSQQLGIRRHIDRPLEN